MTVQDFKDLPFKTPLKITDGIYEYNVEKHNTDIGKVRYSFELDGRQFQLFEEHDNTLSQCFSFGGFFANSEICKFQLERLKINP